MCHCAEALSTKIGLDVFFLHSDTNQPDSHYRVVSCQLGHRSDWFDSADVCAAGRYHLYISYACPWACRALATVHLKGLEDVIGLSVVVRLCCL